MSYRGESDGKRLTRFMAYTVARECWIRIGYKRRGFAVGLAGDEAADVPLMRWLGYEDQSISLVDIRRECISAASQRYPDIVAFHGRIEDVIEDARKMRVEQSIDEGLTRGKIGIDFLCLDLMGHLEGWARACLDRWSAHASANSIAVVTMLMARETRSSHHHVFSKSLLRRKRRIAKQVGQLPGRDQRWLARHVRASIALPPPFHEFFRAEYNSGRSPMMVIGAIKCPVGQVQRFPTFNLPRVDQLTTPVDYARNLWRRGYSTADLVGWLNLSDSERRSMLGVTSRWA